MLFVAIKNVKTVWCYSS